ELIDLSIEIEIRERATVARLALPDERGLVPPRPAHVPVDAIDARVNRAADEPLRMRRLPLEHCRPFGKPFELRRERRPECFGILFRALVDTRIVDVGFRAELGGWHETAIFLKQVGDLCRWFLVSHGKVSS